MNHPPTIYQLPPRCWLKPPRRFHPAQDLHGARLRDVQYWLVEFNCPALPSRLGRWALARYAARWRYREQFARDYDNEDGTNYGRADYWNNLTRGQASTRARSIVRLSA